MSQMYLLIFESFELQGNYKNIRQLFQKTVTISIIILISLFTKSVKLKKKYVHESHIPISVWESEINTNGIDLYPRKVWVLSMRICFCFYKVLFEVWEWNID